MMSIYDSLFSYSSEEGHLGASFFLTDSNKTAVNIYVQYVKVYHTFSISDQKCKYYGSCILSFLIPE